MIDRSLNLFSTAFLMVMLTVFVFVFAGTPMGCGFRARPALPWASSAALLKDSQSDLEIRLTRDGWIFVGANLVPERLLRRELAEIAERGVDRQVLIHADGTVPFSRVRTVLAASRDAGFTELSLVTFRGTMIDAWQKGGAV